MVSIRMVLNVTEYHADVYYNSHTGERAYAAFPDGVIDDVNYDGSIRAFLLLLNNDCCTSIDKSRAFLSDLTGGKLNISKGMISRLNREFALKTEPERRSAYADMLLSPVMHKLKLNGGDIKAVQGDSGHAQVNMVTDVYSHILDDDRRKNAELFEEAFYEKKNLDPQMHVQQENNNTVADEVDPELLAKVLANPEMRALLNSLAKTMK